MLDVDGVLAPFGNQEDPEGFERHYCGPDWVWLSREHTELLQDLARHYKLIWATAWEEHANEVIAPWHGLGPLPVISFGVSNLTDFKGELDELAGIFAKTWKLPFITAWVERFYPTNPVVWIDDDMDSDCDAWVAERKAPTMVIRTLPSVGFTRDHHQRLLEFRESHGSVAPPSGEGA